MHELIFYQVFDLYGIKYVHIDGEMSFEERAKIVRRFCTDPEIRVLIFSSVGTVGLNLSIAHIVIFVVRLHAAT
jgi:SNF2 family DNA or RNA helicase